MVIFHCTALVPHIQCQSRKVNQAINYSIYLYFLICTTFLTVNKEYFAKTLLNTVTALAATSLLGTLAYGSETRVTDVR